MKKRTLRKPDRISSAIKLSTEIFHESYTGSHPDRACFYWVKAGILGFQNYDIEAIAQAGSVQWQISHHDNDHNAFAYSWQGSQEVVIGGKLPEIHCWFILPDLQILIDLTARYQAANCLEMLGLNWSADLLLPETITIGYGKPHKNSDRWFYQPNQEAIKYLFKIWQLSPWGR